MGYFDDNNWWNTHVKPITGPLFAPNDWLPSGGADPQDFIYLETMPGAFARRMTNLRTCDPLWPVFGCKVSVDGTHTEVVPAYELPYQFQNEEEDGDASEGQQQEQAHLQEFESPTEDLDGEPPQGHEADAAGIQARAGTAAKIQAIQEALADQL